MKAVTNICSRHFLHEVRKISVVEPNGSPNILKLVTGQDLQPFAPTKILTTYLLKIDLNAILPALSVIDMFPHHTVRILDRPFLKHLRSFLRLFFSFTFQLS
jgi:hypothetical protein